MAGRLGPLPVSMLTTASLARVLRVASGGDPIQLARALALEVRRCDLDGLLAAFLPAVPPETPVVLLDSSAGYQNALAAIAVAAAHRSLGHRSQGVYAYTSEGPLGVPWDEAEEARRFLAALLTPP